MRDHPIITKMVLDGYLEEDISDIDYFGNIVTSSDEIVEDDDGEFVLKEYLKEFLEDKYSMKFKKFGE